MGKPLYYCTSCKRDEVAARATGCGDPASRVVTVYWEGGRTTEEMAACPMELRSPVRRFLRDRFGYLRIPAPAAGPKNAHPFTTGA